MAFLSISNTVAYLLEEYENEEYFDYARVIHEWELEEELEDSSGDIFTMEKAIKVLNNVESVDVLIETPSGEFYELHLEGVTEEMTVAVEAKVRVMHGVEGRIAELIKSEAYGEITNYEDIDIPDEDMGALQDLGVRDVEGEVVAALQDMDDAATIAEAIGADQPPVLPFRRVL